MYIDGFSFTSSIEPEQTKAQKANDKIEGKKFQDNEDGLRKVYHIYTCMELENDTRTKGEMAPYILMIDEADLTTWSASTATGKRATTP